MVDRGHDPWDVTAEQYPSAGTPTARFRFLLRYAVLAPSGHNTQPWRFRITPDAVEIIADRTRALPVADPDDRELTIACGAALFHLGLAMRNFGHVPIVELLPGQDDPDLLARVGFGEPMLATPDEAALFRVIPLRRTNRRPFDGRPLPAALPKELVAAAAAEGAWLHPVDEPAVRAAIADLIAAGDRRQWDDKRFRRELAAWLHPSRAGDGLPDLYLHGVGPLVVRTLDLGQSTARKDHELAESAPFLAVLGTDRDEPIDWLTAGQALARVLLRAKVEAIDASYLNQPMQVVELRPVLAETIGRANGFPHIVLRFGSGEEVAPSPRRPVTDVLVDVR